MRLFGKLALASALATATLSMAVATPALAQKKDNKKKEESAPKLKNSKGFFAAYVATDALITAGDIAGAKAAAEAAIAAIENDDDKLVGGQLLLTIADKQTPKDLVLAVRGYDLLLSTPSLAAADRPVIAYNAGRMAYTLKDHAKAIKYMEVARAAGYSSPDMEVIDGHSRLNLDDTSGFDVMRAAVAGKVAANEAPSEQWLRLPAGAAERMKNPTELLYWTRELVKFYPTKENWRLALALFDMEVQIPQDMRVDYYRLRRETKSMVSEREYADYLDAVSLNGLILLPQEALDTIQEGIDAGILTADEQFVKEFRADARTALADDEANSAAREKRAIASGNGRSILSSADVALNIGNNARAVELYDLAAQNGADANVTNLRKGIALYKMGDKSAAKLAFTAVTGAPRAEIAAFWLLLIDTTATPKP